MSNTEDWTCPYCGREEDDEPPHAEIEMMDGELVGDVTCETVHIMRDDGYGVALDYSEFERLVELYEQAKEASEELTPVQKMRLLREKKRKLYDQMGELC